MSSVGTVLEIYLAPEIHKPMVRVDRAVAIPNRGLDGDHRCSAKLVYERRLKATLGRDTPQRQVSLLDVDQLAEANASFLEAGVSGVRPLTTMQMRRNLVTSGIRYDESFIGREFKVGIVWVRGTVLATPCSIPLWTRATEDAPYRQDHYDAFIPAFWQHGGLAAEVLSTGVIRVGAQVIEA